ncbi:MAG: phosphoribosylamine--glycine ligase [Candidatus Helarchaeota archaeon]
MTDGESVLIIGSGGREHALAWLMAKSKKVARIFTAPGNPGTALVGKNVEISPNNFEGLIDFALKEKIDLTITGSESQLGKGIVDAFEKADLTIYGPTQELAKLEVDKIYGKEVMTKAGIATPAYWVFTDLEAAKAKIMEDPKNTVVKHPSGDMGGKGVHPCHNQEDALQEVDKMFQISDTVIIEQFAGEKGVIHEEASCMVICSGRSYVPLIFSQDHKKEGEGDTGSNTGGMGAYAPCEITRGYEQWILTKIVEPTLKVLDGKFYGTLYIALISNPSNGDWPFQVLEYNARFGDPELQPIAMLLDAPNFYDILKASALHEDLSDYRLKWHPGSAICTVMANKGYPRKDEIYQSHLGKVILGLDDPYFNNPWVTVFHAGTKQNKDGEFIIGGGRTLNVCTRGKDILDARAKCLEALAKIKCDGLRYRKDIGYRDVERFKSRTGA